MKASPTLLSVGVAEAREPKFTSRFRIQPARPAFRTETYRTSAVRVHPALAGRPKVGEFRLRQNSLLHKQFCNEIAVSFARSWPVRLVYEGQGDLNRSALRLDQKMSSN